MQLWEYMQLIWSEEMNVDPRSGVGRLLQYQMNGLPVRDTGDMKPAEFINALGAQGWELVGCGNLSVDKHCLYFKRPRS